MRGNIGNIVVLTGAGISAESGLATFRAQDGLWENHRVEDVATPEAFVKNPELVQLFYNKRRQQLNDVKPNRAHQALAELEENWPGSFLLVTQNVDDLHERAGSKNLIHMHGELRKAHCTSTLNVYDWDSDITTSTRCDCCEEIGRLRPHIVWFGEMPLEMDRICAELEASTYFISIGTSGNVYPAAGFVQIAKLQGHARTIEINLEPSQTQSYFDEKLYGPASKEVPKFVDMLLKTCENG